jgi:hypothetical protein
MAWVTKIFEEIRESWENIKTLIIMVLVQLFNEEQQMSCHSSFKSGFSKIIRSVLKILFSPDSKLVICCNGTALLYKLNKHIKKTVGVSFCSGNHLTRKKVPE